MLKPAGNGSKFRPYSRKGKMGEKEEGE